MALAAAVLVIALVLLGFGVFGALKILLWIGLAVLVVSLCLGGADRVRARRRL